MMSTAQSKSRKESTKSAARENTTLLGLDSSRIKRKHKKERRLYRIRDRIDQLIRGQACFSPVLLSLRDSNNRFHCEKGPAIKWEDGEKAYFLEGIHFDFETWKGLVENTLSPIQAMSLVNLTQRRYAIKKIGYAECVKSLGFTQITREGTYAILEGNLDDDQGRQTRILQVRCPSTGFDYFLRIPPTPRLISIQEAVAWTFGFDTWPRMLIQDQEENDSTLYHPEVET